MSYEQFPDFLRLAVYVFWGLLPFTQWTLFRELKRRARDPDLLGSKSVRDHVLAGFLRALGSGLVLLLPVLAWWSITNWDTLGWRVLFGAEIFLAFLLLAAGLATLAARLSLGALGRGQGRSALLSIRLGLMFAGGGYGAALLLLYRGGSMEILIGVMVLGVATAVQGLNRLADTPAEILERLARS